MFGVLVPVPASDPPVVRGAKPAAALSAVVLVVTSTALTLGEDDVPLPPLLPTPAPILLAAAPVEEVDVTTGAA